jgi:regulatory protein
MLTITKLEPQKKNPRRINVYLDGEFAFGISQAVAPWLEEGKQLSQQGINDLQTRDAVEQAYQRALHFLGYRNRSEQELRLHLQKHQESETIITEVLAKLRRGSLLDDRQFAQEWVENRSRFHPRSKKALSSELYRKGIPDQIIQEVLEDLNEGDLALQLARKKMPKLNTSEKSSFQEKLYGYLSRRGFSYQVSKDVISQLWEEQEKQS